MQIACRIFFLIICRQLKNLPILTILAEKTWLEVIIPVLIGAFGLTLNGLTHHPLAYISSKKSIEGFLSYPNGSDNMTCHETGHP